MGSDQLTVTQTSEQQQQTINRRRCFYSQGWGEEIIWWFSFFFYCVGRPISFVCLFVCFFQANRRPESTRWRARRWNSFDVQHWTSSRRSSSRTAASWRRSGARTSRFVATKFCRRRNRENKQKIEQFKKTRPPSKERKEQGTKNDLP